MPQMPHCLCIWHWSFLDTALPKLTMYTYCAMGPKWSKWEDLSVWEIFAHFFKCANFSSSKTLNSLEHSKLSVHKYFYQGFERFRFNMEKIFNRNPVCGIIFKCVQIYWPGVPLRKVGWGVILIKCLTGSMLGIRPIYVARHSHAEVVAPQFDKKRVRAR